MRTIQMRWQRMTQGAHHRAWVILLLSTWLMPIPTGWAATLVEDFYVPFPEAQIYEANNAIVSGTGSSIDTTISIHVVANNTVIYYDQWEDGYEPNLGSPTNATTRIWGDGNDAHGIPPGMAHNPLGLSAGTIITLTNVVATQPRNPAVLDYDGRDHIGATQPIVVTRAHWPSTTGTVIAGAVSVLPTIQWGTNYTSPVGQDMTNGLMRYVGMFVQAAQNNTLVTIDPTGTNGAGVTNILLNQGESYLYNGGILRGGRAVATLPVQADLVIGDTKSSYAVDWFTLYPVSSWGNNYYTPVGSSASGNPAYVYLFNPNTNVLNVQATTKSGASIVAVPAKSSYQFTMPAASGGSFIATNSQVFNAVCTVNALPSADATYNWGFALVPTPVLTTESDVGWAPGSSDGTENGSPVWVTALGATKLYVVYGDGTNSLTDPAGNKYSTNFAVSAYQSQKIYDPSKNQTGMRIYTLDGTLLTAAWGEDADVAGAGNPYIDAGYTVLPFPVLLLKKSVANLSNPGQPVSTNGTRLQYTVVVANNNLVPIDNFPLSDSPSPALQYVANSTTNFTSLSTNSFPDKSGGLFPLSSPGYTNPIIEAQSSITFTYDFIVTNTSLPITNFATIPAGVVGLLSALTASTAESATNGTGANNASVNFTTSSGAVTGSYVVGTNVYVTVTNAAANLSSTSIDTVNVTVVDAVTGDSEAVVLTETGPNTGVFINSSGLPTSATAGLYANDGTLNTLPGDSVIVTYIDAAGTVHTANATLTGSSSGLTKQLYLNSTNGTAQALNRYSPVYYGYGTTLASVDIGSASSGSSTVAVDATVGTNTGAADASSLTISQTTGSGSNRLMVVGIAFADTSNSTTNGAVTNVVYGTTSLTRLMKSWDSSYREQTEVWYLLNPPSGTANLVVHMTNSTQQIIAGVTTFSNVNPTTPFGTIYTNSYGTSTYTGCTNIVPSTPNALVYQAVTWDGNGNPFTNKPGTGQTQLWSSGPSANAAIGGASTKPGTTSSTNYWTLSTARRYSSIAMSVNPASVGGTSGPATNATAFVQIPAFNAPFTLPADSLFYITNYITLTNGTFAANPNVTATLQTNNVAFLTLSNPTYNSGTGVNTNLVWTNVLSGNVTIPANTAITCVISNNVSGTAFHVNYGSASSPSVIVLPASPATVIAINSFGLYDAPYPGGAPVSSPVAGTTVYVRATVSDPFGNYDISSLGLALTAPGGGVGSVNAPLVATTATTAIYEYAWTGTTAVGSYAIAATANEGTEGITATATATLTTSFVDLGTPNTTTFTSGGASTNAYPFNHSSACVLVQDLSANTNPLAADTVVVTVSSSAGGSIQVSLTETGTNTGSFAGCFNTTTNLGNASSSTLYAPAGAVLSASYASLTSPAYQSSATALIQPPAGVSSLTVSKTIASPSGGQTLLGQPVTYNVQVFNNGSTTLSGLAVTDSYPAQLTYTNASPAPAITNTASHLLIWTNLGPFTPGQSTNLVVTFSATSASPATNNAWASGGGAPAVTNSVPLVINNPGVSITKTVLNPVPTNQVGSSIVFQIVITNTGNTTIPTLPLEDNFSGACFQFVSNNIISTNAAAITGNRPSSGSGSLVWTNLAPTNGLAPGGVITNNVTLVVVGQGYPANNTAIVDYAVDSLGDAVPVSSATIGVTNSAASISGHAYHDATANHSGVYTNIDTGLSGVTVSLYTDSNSIPGALVAVATTEANGAYQFLNLSTNKYLVVESLVPGFAASSSVSVATNVSALAAYTNIDFFAYQPSAASYASISGSVTNDLNWNGVANAGEPGLANVTINLVQDLNANGLADDGEPVVLTTATGTNGGFSFSAIPPGNYVLQAVVPHGFYPTNVTLGAGSGGFLAATNAAGILTNFTQIGLVLTSAQNSSQNNFLLGQYQLSGDVFDDANGLTDGLVNGTPTNATGGLLYANLLSADSNVLVSVTVATNGSYVFTNLTSGTYLVQLSANAGTVGSAAPAMVLPAGWVNTGGSTNGAIAGNTHGLLTVQLATVLTNANFGIDQLPTSLPATAGYLNPGETSAVTVPALTGTDPEQGALGGTTNTVVIETLPVNGTLFYNGVAATAGQVIADYNPALLTVEAGFEGAGVVAFTFAMEDAAGEASATAAGVTINFSGVTLGGTVYDDANGLTDGLVNGATTNATGAPLYINLIDGSGNVLSSVAVSTNGAYVFPSISGGSVTVQLSANAGTVGSAAPAMVLPAGWVNTGGSTNGVVAGNTNGLVMVQLASALTNANFGIDQLPTSLPATAGYLNPGETSAVTVPALTGTDPEQGALGGTTNTVVIETLPVNGTLFYNGVAATAGQVIADYNPALLTVAPGFEGAGVVAFTFAMEDAAGEASATAAGVTINFSGVTLGGTVYDDANGLTDGLVNGATTNATGAPLYINLIDGSGNVLSSVAVSTNGAYVFPSISGGSVTVQLSANAGTVGSAAPAMVLPAGWVNTGGSTNGAIAGNTHGLLTVQLATVLTNANFGIDQLPTSLPATAGYLNPGETSAVTVPALTGTDPEQGALGGTTNTVVIETLPVNGTLFYNGVAATAGQVIADYSPALLTVNAGFAGAGTVAFTFAIEDAAGEASVAAAGVTINFSGLTLGGTVYNDTNGLVDGVVNGTGTNLDGMLYVNLLNPGSNVLANVAVAGDGSYSFPNISEGNYILQLSVNAGTVGLAAPATALPAGWLNAGENLGAGAGSDGHPDGLLAVNLLSSTNDANFGIWQIGGISGRALVDVNGNGLVDASDTNGISGVTVVLLTTNGVALATNVTGSAGGYVFANVAPGIYVLAQAALPPGWFATGGDPFVVTLDGGGAPVHDFLDAQPGNISGSVLDDVNRLGVFDASDTGVGGVTVVLQTTNGTPVATNVTTAAGSYLFTNVMPGSYVVVGTDLPCWTSVANTSGTNDNQIPLNLTTGEASTGNNFLEEPSADLWNAGASLAMGVTNAAGNAGVGYGTQYYSCYLDIMATTNNPFTIDLASYSGGSPGPAAGWSYTNTYTWTVATAADGVLNFAADKIVVDTSAFTNDLAGGTFSVTSDGYSVFLVYTPHPAPVALPMSISRAWGTFLHISIPMLLSNYTAAAAGDATLLSQVGPSTNGSYVVINTVRDTIDFAPTNNLPESFTYVITDTQVYRPGDTVLTATNWITVNVTNATSLVQQVTSAGSSVVITFAGVPGYKYVVERATDLAGPWTTLDGSNGTVDSQIVAPATGVWTFTEIPPSSPVFYRSRQDN